MYSSFLFFQKNNRGNISFEDMPLLPMHTLWMEEFAKMHGGLDITGIMVKILLVFCLK